MNNTFDIIEYMSGLTAFVLDESVLKRIAMDRGVMEVTDYSELTQKDKDLLTADIYYTLCYGPSSLPSFQHQHGQFSTSTGQQSIKDKENMIHIMRVLYGRWGDEKAELISDSSLQWLE